MNLYIALFDYGEYDLAYIAIISAKDEIDARNKAIQAYGWTFDMLTVEKIDISEFAEGKVLYEKSIC
jgi:hypothetical protein